MIQLTRLNRVPFYLNPDLVEHIETTPDTVISLTTGQKFLVQESADSVVELILAYRQRVVRGAVLERRGQAAEVPPPGAEASREQT